MDKRIRPFVETAAIEEPKLPNDIRDFFKGMANNRPPRVGPMSFPMSYSKLPRGSRVAVIDWIYRTLEVHILNHPRGSRDRLGYPMKVTWATIYVTDTLAKSKRDRAAGP